MIFVLRDYSGDKRLTPPVLQQLADALAGQLNEDVSPEWGGGYVVRVGAVSESLSDKEIELAIFQHEEQAGAAGFHAVDPRGRPYAKAFLDDADSIGVAPDIGSMPLSGILSHEAVETSIDPAANLASIRLDGKTAEMLEGCDRCEDTGYEKSGVYVSNFLLKAAFNGQSQGPYTFMDVGKDSSQWLIAAPDGKTPGGYVILMIVGDVSYAMHVEASEAKLKDEKWRKRKSFAGSRTSRRGVKLEASNG